MISVLLVDDSPFKIKAIKDLINLFPDIEKDNVVVVNDAISAKEAILNRQFDLMILDISLPERFGDIPEEDGGVKFLSQINIDPDSIVPFHIIGMTAFSELKDKFTQSFSDHLWFLIHYNEQYDNWKVQLSNRIKYLIKSKTELMNPSNKVFNYDVAIVTVLSLELKFVKLLPGSWIEQKFENDDSYYYVGTFQAKAKIIKVVLTSSNNNMGMSAAAITSMKVINRYTPRYLAMVGICAGIEGKGNIGDPIICDRVWDYGSGKHVIEKTAEGEKELFKPYINQLSLNNSLSSLFTKLTDSSKYLKEIKDNWPVQNNSLELKAHLGPFASGSAVIANENIVESIKNQHGKILGFDMEAYAVFYAAANCQYPQPTSFCVKSISDFGNSLKNNLNKDADQAYAAYTSANYLYNVIVNELTFKN